MSLISRPVDGTVIAIMVVWNGEQYLNAALDSVLSELRSEDDLLVVDNGSTDDSFQVISKLYPSVAVLRTHENLGGAGGFNAGVAEALKSEQCKYIWLLDNDILVEPGALQPLIGALEFDPYAAAAGSQICIMNKPDTIQEVGAYYTSWLGALRTCHTGRRRLDKTHDPFAVDYLAACSMLVRALVIRENGLFSNFFIFYDDVEWGLRQNRAGRRLWAVPASVVQHNYSELKPTIPWREYYRKRNRAICLTAHPPLKGKYFALWVSMAALNYRVFLCRTQGDTSLFEAYQLAVCDLLAGKLGRCNISTASFTSSTPSDIGRCIYLDIQKTGDALAAVTHLKALLGEPHLFVHPRKHSLLDGVVSNLCRSKDVPSHACGVIDDEFSFFALLSCSKFFLYRHGQLKQIDRPYALYIRNWLLRGLGICYAIWKATFQVGRVVGHFSQSE